jgi:hypothetical protein
MRIMHLPNIYITRLAQEFPGCWQDVDTLRAQRGKKLPQWPDWCFLPMAGAYGIVGKHNPDNLPAIAALAAVAAWRVTQGIYDIHPAVVRALESTPLSGDIPTEVLHRMPEWCVYIRTPGRAMAGFFALLEWDANSGREELRLTLDYPPTLASAIPIHLGGTTVEAGILAAIETARQEAARMPDLTHREQVAQALTALEKRELLTELSPLVNMVLYLCAQNAEVRDPTGKRTAPERPAPTKTKHGERIFPPSRPTTWDVGWRTGAALESASRAESAESTGAHASPRPHIRRAHWHHYRTGKGRTETVLKWLAPMAINVDLGEVIPTIREVGNT